METANHQILTKKGSSTNKTNSYMGSSWSERRRRIRILVCLVIVTCLITSVIQLCFNSTFTRTYSGYDNIDIDSNYSTASASASGSPPSYELKTPTSSTSSSSSPFRMNITITNQTNIIKDDNDNDNDSALAWQKRHEPLRTRIDFVVAGFPKCGTTTLLRRLSDVPQIYMGGDIDTETNETIGVREVHNLEKLGNKDSLKVLKDFFRRFSILNITRGTNLTATQLQAQTQSYEQEVHTDTDTDTTTTSATANNSISLLKPVVGFKAPRVISAESALLHTVKLFPSIDLMISVRHPVLHFQSNYNFKLRFANETLLQQPNSSSLIGDCGGECSIYRQNQKPHLRHCLPRITFTTREGWIQTRSDVCTLTSTFHYALSRLGLTPLSSETEWELLDHHPWSIVSGWKGRLFLMETTQLADGDNGHADRLGQWERQVENFLGIEPHSFNSTKPLVEEEEEITWPRFMNICDEEHGELRAYLLEVGERSATWIKTYLMEASLESERVVIPNREHFLELIDKWSIDPCKN